MDEGVPNDLPVERTQLEITTELVLFNDLVLERIFLSLTNKELKVCRLVCAKWEEISRRFYKKEADLAIDYLKPNRTAKHFLNAFPDPSIELPFSGIVFWNRIDILYREENAILTLLKRLGNQLRRIAIKMYPMAREGDISTEQVYKFCGYMPQYEDFESYIAYKQEPREIKMKNIKQLELTFYSFIKFQDEEENNILSRLVKEWIENSEQFTTLITDNDFMFHHFWENQMTPKGVSKIKNLSISINEDQLEGEQVRSWTPGSVGLYLKALTTKGIRLNSFSFDVPIRHYIGGNLCLANFLQGQLMTLQSLTIRWSLEFLNSQEGLNEVPIRVVPHNQDLPVIPILAKVKHLKLCSPLEIALQFFGKYPLWIQLFPNLKTLCYEYNSEDYKQLPKFLQMLSPSCNGNVHSVTLKPTQCDGPGREGPFGPFSLNMKDVAFLYRKLKEKFQNLKTIEVYYEDRQIIFKYQGSMVDSLMYPDNQTQSRN